MAIHAALPQAVLLVLAFLFATLWVAALGTRSSWVEAAPYMVLSGVFFCGSLVVWAVVSDGRPSTPGTEEE